MKRTFPAKDGFLPRLPLIAVVFCVAGFLFVASAFAAEPVVAPLRLAVIAGEGERTPKPGVVELLTVELSKLDGVVVLEREDVRRILTEQALNAGGLANRSQAVRLGAILHADALLVVERLGSVTNAAYRLKTVEARTGVVAGDQILEEDSSGSAMNAAASELCRCIDWLRLPAERRRYVALLGYTPERKDSGLTDLPAALGALVERQLAQSASVLIVDRECLRQIQEEQNLAGGELQLARSSYLVEGQIRQAGESAVITIQTQLHPVRGKADLPVIEQTGSPSNVLAAARAVAAAILRQIDAAPLAADPVAGSAEADRIVQYADTLQRYGDTEHDMPLLESAYALDPKPETALRLAKVIHRVALQRAGSDTNTLDEVAKQSLLEDFDRAMRLWQVDMDARLAAGPDSTRALVKSSIEAAPHELGNMWQRLDSGAAGTQALYRELRRQKEVCRQKEDGYVRKFWPSSSLYYLDYLLHEAAEVDAMCRSGADYAAQLRELLTTWVELPHQRPADWILLWEIAQRPRWRGFPSCTLDAEGSNSLLAFGDWLAGQPSVDCRMAGLCFKVLVCKKTGSAQGGQPARKMVELYPEFLQKHEFSLAVWCILLNTIQIDAYAAVDEHALYTEMLDDNVKYLSAQTFVEWFTHDQSRFALRGFGNLGATFERRWLAAAAAKLPSPKLARYRDPVYQAGIDSVAECIAQRQSVLDGQAASDVQINPFWRAYRVEAVVAGALASSGRRLELCKRDGERLVLVWSKPAEKNGGLMISAETLDLALRPLAAFQSIALPHGVQADDSGAVRDVACDGDRVCVAAGDAGLLVFGPESSRILDAGDGLPHETLVSVAVAGGKAYLGYAPDYLMLVDLGTRHVQEIAYSRSLLKRNPLDGCPQRFDVRSLVADPARACVWVATARPDATWRLSTDSLRLERAADASIWALSLDGGDLLGARDEYFFRFDATRGKWSVIPLYGGVYCMTGLHVQLGTDVISAGTTKSVSTGSGRLDVAFHGKGGLYLHKTSCKHAFHLALEHAPSPKQIDFLVKTSDRTALAATHAGTCWLLTRTNDVSPEEQALDVRVQAMQALAATQTNRLAVRGVTASSTAAPAKKRTYEAANLCDGNPDTCWASATNENRGAWVEFSFDRPVKLTSLRLINGWLANYVNNHRARTIVATTDAGEQATLAIDDDNDPQSLPLSFLKPVQRLRLTVADIYEAEYNDPLDPAWLTLSDVALFGDPAP